MGQIILLLNVEHSKCLFAGCFQLLSEYTRKINVRDTF